MAAQYLAAASAQGDDAAETALQGLLNPPSFRIPDRHRPGSGIDLFTNILDSQLLENQRERKSLPKVFLTGKP